MIENREGTRHPLVDSSYGLVVLAGGTGAGGLQAHYSQRSYLFEDAFA